MKLIYEKSSGDTQLYKCIIYKIPKIAGYDDNYDETLQAYLYVQPYQYNWRTRETDDRLVTHRDIVDSVPREIRKAADDIPISGKTDCYLKHGNEEHPIRLWFTDHFNQLTDSDKNYLKKMFGAKYVV